MNYNEKNIFEYGLNKCDANYQPLSPITFLERTAFTFPNKKAIIYDKKIYTYVCIYKDINICIYLLTHDH